jgi:uncharacterized protein YxjI
MGACCDKMEIAITEGATGGLSASQSIDGQITQSTTALQLQEKFLSWTGDDFEIKTPDGTVLYKVDGKTKLVGVDRDQMIVSDASGTPVCVIQKKLAAVRATYSIFAFNPNQSDQEPEGDIEGRAFYKFAQVNKQLIGRQYNYYFCKGDEPNDVESFILQPKFGFGFQANIYIADGEGEKSDDVVATIGQAGLFQMESANTYAINVAPGMDLLGMLAFSVVVDKIREEDSMGDME